MKGLADGHFRSLARPLHFHIPERSLPPPRRTAMNRTRARRLTLPVLTACCLVLVLAPRSSEAGHRSHFSFSFGYSPYSHYGYHHSHYSYAPRFYAYGYPYRYSYGYPSVEFSLRRGARSEIGAIRLKVKPKKTEVYLDGQSLGRAGRYDGYPGYLWLEKGAHTLVFYREGFRTFSRSFEVRRGMVTEVRVAMEAGETRPPEELVPATPRSARERSRTAPPPAGASSQGLGSVAVGRGEVLDLRAEGGRIRVVVEPLNASVYLNGRFLGTGGELGRLHGGLMVDEGEHEIEVVHPSHQPDRVSFRVRAGEDLEIRVILDALPES